MVSNCFSNLTAKNNGLWSRIAKTIRSIHKNSLDGRDCISRRVGNGNHTRFWKDAWCVSEPLEAKFPRLAALDSDINCRVSDRWFDNEWRWCWRRPISNTRVMEMLKNLTVLLPNRLQSEDNDKWVWDLKGNNEFVVADLRKRIDHARFTSGRRIKTLWNSLVPKKVNLFIWRLRRAAIPTRVNLFARGIDVDTFSCPLCRAGVETVTHVFQRCKRAEDTRLLLNSWLRIVIPNGSIEEIITWCDKLKVKKQSRFKIQAITFVWWWYTWKLRNDKIHNNTEETITCTFNRIVTISYGWIHNRDKKDETSWDTWKNYPL